VAEGTESDDVVSCFAAVSQLDSEETKVVDDWRGDGHEEEE
jgi:hypothetical protein